MNTAFRAVWLSILALGCGASGASGASGAGAAGASGATAASGGSGTATGGSSSGGRASGGVTGSGGATATGGTNPGSGGTAAAGATGSGGGTHVVGSCVLGDVGQWQNISPSVYKYANAFVLDPLHAGTIYATGGNEGGGRQKSTDCGTTWTKINTGKNADVMDKDGSWTMVIDPVDSQILYANVNYGAMGLYKTTNGGVDWEYILTPDAAKALQYGGFVEHIAMDPTNHLHLTVTPHFSCENGHDPHCLIETTDGGVSWTVVEGTPGMGEGGGQIMLDAKTWYFASGGLFRTTDAGGSWKQVSTAGTYPTLYRPDSGGFFFPTSSGILKSDDGAAFSILSNSPKSVGLTGDGKSLFASWQWGQGYYTAKLAAPTSWSTYASPSSMSVAGWMLDYDRDHHVLYSANTPAGLWRVRTE